MTSKTPPLLRLPTELHLEIISYFHDTPFTQIEFRLTNRYFYRTTPQLTIEQVFNAEHEPFAIYRGLRACRYCCRLRLPSKFADTMLYNADERYSYFGVVGSCWRFCLECGFEGAGENEVPKDEEGFRYSKGTDLKVHGMRWVWCRICMQVKQSKQDRAAMRCVGICEACCEEKCPDPCAAKTYRIQQELAAKAMAKKEAKQRLLREKEREQEMLAVMKFLAEESRREEEASKFAEICGLKDLTKVDEEEVVSRFQRAVWRGMWNDDCEIIVNPPVREVQIERMREEVGGSGNESNAAHE